MSGDGTEIGDRLKTIRRSRGLTLSETSRRTGVSVSALSKVERGEVSPSFDVIKRICDGLEIAIEQFVKPGPKRDVSGRKTVTRAGEAVPFTSGQYDYLAHATELSRKGMVPLEIRVRARSPDEFDHWSRHAGEEYVFVLSGAIEIHTEHYAPFQLRQGESAYFDSSMEHVYVSIGDEDAHLLSVSHDPAERQAGVAAFMHPATQPAPAAPAAVWPAAKRRARRGRAG